jgi:hypothetical protein
MKWKAKTNQENVEENCTFTHGIHAIFLTMKLRVMHRIRKQE